MSEELVYKRLREVMENYHNGNSFNLYELAFLTGAVHSLRLVNGFQCEEIEDAFLLLNRTIKLKGGFESCLKHSIF